METFRPTTWSVQDTTTFGHDQTIAKFGNIWLNFP